MVTNSPKPCFQGWLASHGSPSKQVMPGLVAVAWAEAQVLADGTPFAKHDGVTKQVWSLAETVSDGPTMTSNNINQQHGNFLRAADIATRSRVAKIVPVSRLITLRFRSARRSPCSRVQTTCLKTFGKSPCLTQQQSLAVLMHMRTPHSGSMHFFQSKATQLQP